MGTGLAPLNERASSELANVLDRQMTEKELLGAVEQMADAFGWLHYHTFDSRKSNAGFPDLVLVRAPEVVFVELKVQGGKATLDQVRWAEALADCSVYWRGAVAVARQGRGSGRSVSEMTDADVGAWALVPVRYFVWRPSDWRSGAIEDVLRR